MLPITRSAINLIQRSFVTSQVRNVTVVKRVYRVRQPNSEELHKNLDTKTAQTYEVIAHTECEKKKPVSVVLKQFVEGYGDAGDIIEVLPGTARYGLILPGLADYATPETIAKAKEAAVGTEKQSFSSAYAPLTIRMIRNRVFILEMSEVNAWTLEPWHVRVALRRNGLIVPESAIILPKETIQGPSEDVFNKDVLVTLLINGKDEALCRLRLRSSKQSITDMLDDGAKPWYLDPVEPLIESQADMIRQMHENVVSKYESVLERRRNKGV